MNVAFVGLGKLGLPCALAMEAGGSRNFLAGYDISPEVIQNIKDRKITYEEDSAQAYLDKSHIIIRKTMEDLADHKPDIIFVAVQTPHQPAYEGVTRLTNDRADFDYTYLQSACESLAQAYGEKAKFHGPTVVVISTVLPGTMDKVVKPALGHLADRLVYNPFFIAMGTAIYDFYHPEFVLLGSDSEHDLEKVKRFYLETLGTGVSFAEMSIRSAELTKVAYNTFIGAKLSFVNTLAEICDKTGANVDEVTGALCRADKRLLSPAYMRAGMGDGGGCHPRDNIAMSWLARRLDLSHDLFNDLMQQREDHTEWLASIAMKASSVGDYPIVVIGQSYKAGSKILTGSPAVLLLNILHEKMGEGGAFGFEPMTDPVGDLYVSREPHVFVIGTPHKECYQYKFRPQDVVIDPFGYANERDCWCPVILPGRNNASH